MKTEKHSTMVLMPIEDYEKLIKLKDYVGLKKVEKGDFRWQFIDRGIRATTELIDHEKGLQDNVEIYFKIL